MSVDAIQTRPINQDEYLCQLLFKKSGIRIRREEFEYELVPLNDLGLTKIIYHLKGRFSGEISFHYTREGIHRFVQEHYGIVLRYQKGQIAIPDIVTQLLNYFPLPSLTIGDIKTNQVSELKQLGYVEICSVFYYGKIQVQLMDEDEYLNRDIIHPEVIYQFDDKRGDSRPTRTPIRDYGNSGDVVDYYAWPQVNKWRNRAIVIRDHLLHEEPSLEDEELMEKIIDYFVEVLGIPKEKIPASLILTDFTRQKKTDGMGQ